MSGKKYYSNIGTYTLCAYEYRDYVLNHLFNGWYDLFENHVFGDTPEKKHNSAVIKVGTVFADYMIGVMNTVRKMYYANARMPYVATYQLLPYPKISILLNMKFETNYTDQQILDAFTKDGYVHSYLLSGPFECEVDEKPQKYCYAMSGDLDKVTEMKNLGIEVMQYSNAFKYKSPEKAKYYNAGNVDFDMKIIIGMVNELLGNGKCAYELLLDSMYDILNKTFNDKFNTYFQY